MIEIEAPSEFVCPLTLDVMDDPIMTKYGHSYERSAILQWLRSGQGVCPLSRRPLQLQDLVTNHGLRIRIQQWRTANGEDNPVVVKPINHMPIYGFITLPTKDDGTDRTQDAEADDLFFLQLAAMRMGQSLQEVQQPETQAAEESTPGRQRRRQHQRRRASTGSAQQQQRRRSTITRPFRGLRNLLVGSSSSRNSP